MNKHKLSYKLLTYIIPLVIVPLLLLGSFVLYSSSDAATKKAKLFVTKQVASQSQKLIHTIAAYQQTLSLLSYSPALSDFINSNFDALSEDELKQKTGNLLAVFSSYASAYADINSIEFVDNKLRSQAFFSSDLFGESNLELLREELRHLKNDKEVVIISEGDEYGYFNVDVFFVEKLYIDDFESRQRNHKGYLVFNVHSRLLEFDASASSFGQNQNFIYDSKGHILFSSNKKILGKNISLHDLSILASTIEQQNPSAKLLTLFKQKPNLHLAKNIKSDLYYASAFDQNELYIDAERVTVFTFLLVLVTVIFTPLLIFVVVRKLLLTPLLSLTGASRSIAAGNLDIRLSSTSNDEFSALFKDFNHMATELGDYKEKIIEAQKELEGKVERRTSDLNKTNKKLTTAISEAERANEMKSRFLANMSHEIRTPLTAIIGFTEHALSSQIQSHRIQKDLATVLRNGKHLLELINNILDLSKIEADKLTVDSGDVEVIPLVEDVKSIVEAAAGDKGLNFKVNYSYPLPELICSDFTRLKQILLNVASNAIKFTSQGKVNIDVLFSESDSSLCFKVTDTGIGMTKEQMTSIFKPFEQADSSTTRLYGGTGLGLCISKLLSNILGGDISVESEIGKGSVFNISIAIGELSAINWLNSFPHIEQVSSVNQISETYHGRVLVAEDNTDNQGLIRLFLEQAGLNIEIVGNGSQAVEIALAEDFDLILMDMQMPIMGGLEATEMLRTMGFEQPIVALTANVMKEDIVLQREAGCNDTVAKPIDRIELFKTLAKYLPSEPIDEKSLGDDLAEKLQGNDDYKALASNFVQKLPSYMSDIISAYEDEDWLSLQKQAHSLKGSAGCFGFPELTELASKIEMAVKEKNYQALPAYMKELA